MDFAPEPVLDAFTPPPTRSAPRAAAADDNGQSFDDHLDAASEPALERPAPSQNEAKDEAPPVESKPVRSEEAHDEPIDPDVALLGGPAPPALPPMAAPVVVQLAASLPQQTQAEPQSADAEIAPLSAPQAPPPVDAQAAAETAAPTETSAKAEAKPAAPDVAQSPSTPPSQSAPANAQSVQNTTQPPAQQAQVAVQELPAVVQQTIAATVAPAPQATTQATPRATAKAAPQGVEEKVAGEAHDGKPQAPAANANAKPQAPKASGGNVAINVAPALQTQNSAPDGSQLDEANALNATTSQASTHVQHTAAEIGTQRANPAAAQVAREIIRRFHGGSTNFELRLDPAELGRVDVRMEVTRDHRVTAVITADNPQALTELARHARDLEQQLQSAGLQLSENGLSFDLRQGAQGGESNDANSSARGNSGEDALTEQQPTQVARPIGIDRWRGVRVDMMV